MWDKLSMRIHPRVALVLGLLFVWSGCADSRGGSSDCTLYCDSWYECSTTAGMAPGSGSCDFPGTSADAFRSLCVPKCEAIAATLTDAERADAVDCLECMLGQVAPSACANETVADAANGPCEAICSQPGPDGLLYEMGQDPEILRACRARPCGGDTDCEDGQFCGSDGRCLFMGRCANDDSDCQAGQICDFDQCIPGG